MKPHPNYTHPHGRYAREKFSLRSETLCSSLRSRHEPHVHVLHMIHDVCPFPVSSSGSFSPPITMCRIPVPTFKIDAVHAPWLPCQQVEHIREEHKDVSYFYLLQGHSLREEEMNRRRGKVSTSHDQ